MHTTDRPEVLLQRYLQRYGDRIEILDADLVARRLKVRSDGLDLGEVLSPSMRDLVIQAAAHRRIPASWGSSRGI